MLTLQINSDDAMETIRNLENKHLVEVLENSEIDSPSLPGEAMSVKAFKSWITDAERNATISITDAKEKWAHQKKQLQQLTK